MEIVHANDLVILFIKLHDFWNSKYKFLYLMCNYIQYDFLTATWLPHGQLWVTVEGAASLTQY